MRFEITPGRGRLLRAEARVRAARTRSAATGSAERCRSTSNLPERFDATYVAEDSSHQRPVMLHVRQRRLCSSASPASWSSSTPARCRLGWRRCRRWWLPIAENQADYAAEVAKRLQKQGVRVAADLRSDKIGYKIREHSMHEGPVHPGRWRQGKGKRGRFGARPGQRGPRRACSVASVQSRSSGRRCGLKGLEPSARFCFCFGPMLA